MVTAFTSTSPGLTCPGLLAPDRRDAGSRRVGSRVHGRSEDRGYVVPQASDVSVAGDARWGSRPMAEHRVMSEDLLGVTHYTDREDATNRTRMAIGRNACSLLDFAEFAQAVRYGVPETPKQLGMVSLELHGVPGTPSGGGRDWYSRVLGSHYNPRVDAASFQ